MIEVINAAVLANEGGKVWVKETEDVDARQGTLFGALTGSLIGLLAGPAGVIVGAVAGATTGGVAAPELDLAYLEGTLYRHAIEAEVAAQFAAVDAEIDQQLAAHLLGSATCAEVTYI